MELNKYQELASSTAVYPKGEGLTYCVLGLCGESGEVSDKLKRVIRDHDGVLNDSLRVEMALELGDVLWYVANLGLELGYELEWLAEMNLEKLRDRQARGVLSGEGDER